jgi:hypothetical protein
MGLIVVRDELSLLVEFQVKAVGEFDIIPVVLLVDADNDLAGMVGLAVGTGDTGKNGETQKDAEKEFQCFHDLVI